MLAGILHKTILKDYDLHYKMFFACLITGVGFLLFPLSGNFIYLGSVSFFTSIGAGSIEVVIQFCFLVVSGTNAKTILTMSYVVYGLSLMIEPILIALFGINNFYMIGVSALIISIGYLVL